MLNAYIYDGLRSPFGRHAGALSMIRPDDLLAEVIRALVQRNGFDPANIEDVIAGCTNQAGEDARNVARHAGTHEVWVRLTYRAAEVMLEVEDHGSGIPESRTSRSGLGIVAMRERAGLLGGRLELQRPDGGGTLVRLTVPLIDTEGEQS